MSGFAALSDAAQLLLLKSIPKVELHVHLAGACQLESLIAIARERKLLLPYDKLEEFHNHVSISEPQPSLVNFLRPFKYIYKIIGGSFNALEKIAYDFCKASFDAGIIYSELRFNPTLLMSSPIADDKATLSHEQVMDAVLSGLEKGQNEFDIKVKVIVCFTTSMPEKAAELADLAIRYHGKGVVAVDIAGDELIPMTQLHRDAFKKVKDAGLHITVHAGESGPAENVRHAIAVIGADRIGHGYKALDDEKVYTLAKQANVHFEVCPLSSIHTGSQKVDNHAINRFRDDGVNFSINSDDPGIMRTTIIDDYVMASKEFGMDYKQIKLSVLNGVSAAFLSDYHKTLLRERALKKFTEIQTQFNIG